MGFPERTPITEAILSRNSMTAITPTRQVAFNHRTNRTNTRTQVHLPCSIIGLPEKRRGFELDHSSAVSTTSSLKNSVNKRGPISRWPTGAGDRLQSSIFSCSYFNWCNMEWKRLRRALYRLPVDLTAPLPPKPAHLVGDQSSFFLDICGVYRS